MSNDLLNILSHSKDIDQQKLLDYLDGKLSPQERHDIEKLLIDSDFESDAAEGLSQVQDKSKLPAVMNELNRKLVKKLSRRRKKLLKQTPDLIIPVGATVIILLLIFMLYIFLRKFL